MDILVVDGDSGSVEVGLRSVLEHWTRTLIATGLALLEGDEHALVEV